MSVELTIESLGAQGDGIATTAEGQVFVPLTLPGERVRAECGGDGNHAELTEIIKASPDRIAPICPHFGVCGGCSLQHLSHERYRAWKRDLVVQALEARGIGIDVEPLRDVPLANRRRATFSLERQGQDVRLGYRRTRSHETIDIKTCPILAPKIVAALPFLREALAPLLGGYRSARVSITETENGLDIVMDGVRPERSALAKLAAKLEGQGIARITVGQEEIRLAPAELRFGRAVLSLPPGAFLQAAPSAEAEMIKLVQEGVGKAKHIADLFAGLGTFSFALAERAKVVAYEESVSALNALEEGARYAKGLKPIKVQRRDLFGDPLGWQELKAFDALVFDPPRAGASAQAEQLAKSKLKRLVAVSCNPATLARDLRMLIDGGYELTRVVPIDQFLFSSHVEVVAHLKR